MGYTADTTRYITDQIKYKAKVTRYMVKWNVIRYNANKSTVSMIIALLLSTGSTSDLAINRHVLYWWVVTLVDILSNAHSNLVAAGQLWLMFFPLVSKQTIRPSIVQVVVMFGMDIAFSISSVLRIVRLSVMVILEPLSCCFDMNMYCRAGASIRF